MSRALNLNASEAEVLASCARANAPITQIETLASGGTRVVFKNGDDAAAVGKLYKGKIITHPVTRAPSRLQHG
jgi:hypothetical protein